jgi:hypothetical protein
MPTAAVGDIAMHYETEGSGDPLVLIPYLSADHACYAFQTPEYSKHFTCVAVVNRPGSDGGSGYWVPTPAGSAWRAA